MKDGLLIFDFPREFVDAFERAGWRPRVWVRTGRQPGVVHEKGTAIYNHSPLKYCNVDYRLDPTLDRELARQVREQAYPYFLRAINRVERCRWGRKTTWVDKVNQLEMMINWYHDLLRRNEIGTVVFSNVPHGGSTIALFFLAKAMGLDVVICQSMYFPHLFFMVDDFRKIGIFEGEGLGEEREDIGINDDPVAPFYMSHIDNISDNLRDISKFAGKYILNTIVRHFGYEDKRRIYAREVCARLDRISMLRRQARLSENCDLSRKYIYFPLHFQPEMSPDVIGGIYADQLLAVEELRRRLPDDVLIYVKENPKQSVYGREASFFKRLAGIPGAVYVKQTVSTKELIKHSMAVATVVGTAGWEALQMGKPVICFGYAWYKSFPGVQVWPEGFDYEKLEKFQFDRDALALALKRTSRHFLEGVSTIKGYSEQVPGFDPARNAERVVKGILDFLKQRKANTPGNS